MTVATRGSWDGRSGIELAAQWGAPAVEAYDQIGSTNDRALELAREGAARGTVVVAEEQTVGRGRRGATWLSEPGVGLWMSIVLGTDDRSPALPLVVGVACAQAIECLVPALRVGIKWPNDLFVAGRKVGGVLCEGSGGTQVVGVGINVREPAGGFPEEIAASATSLEAAGAKALSRSDLGGAVAEHVIRLLDAKEPYQAAAVELADRDLLAHRTVDTEQEGKGVARGIDPEGRLVLERSDGTRVAIVSGSVREPESSNGSD